ncbi:MULTISPECIES: DUF2254 domain-containing protein [Thiorhodovibrio]|uniref:DUF2254 domain-containing protein n=1 Tax=Thiorhodovibrio TaxID=61593 RepID=UPI00191185E6|nr:MULTISPECIES: DUF2254 domain-containing protein [Thiorhodovibrio]MBK5967736.1 hypothetical protein [Thiorhodovibrio winogradskyi]WPL11684.1 hypothetical protein Thiosp_01434 [Thiorhodovibrio litoralis]
MITKLQHAWQSMRSSFWFVPALMVVDAVVLAIVLITLDTSIDLHLAARWPLIFGTGAAGARGLLTTVASSMITVAGLVFSITLVALSLTSSQYSSRVIRNFMRDRVNQWVLGVFLGIFAYCLVVLRTIREGGASEFVPSLAVLTGLLLAFVGLGVLIHFIHHIATSIQASSIVAKAALETLAAVDKLFPPSPEERDQDGEDDDGRVGENKENGNQKKGNHEDGEGGCNGGKDEDGDQALDDDLTDRLARQPWSPVPARKTGYIERVNPDALLDVARSLDSILRMEHGVGDFVVEDTPLVSLLDPADLNETTTDKLNAAFVISRQRTVEQDVAFGIRQIVDIALKALSPGINDTTTAVMCVDYLAAIMTRLAARRIGTGHGLDQGVVRVIACGPSFESLLSEAFDQIRQDAETNVAILLRLLGALETIADLTASRDRRWLLREKVEEIAEAAERNIVAPHDRTHLARRLTQARAELDRRRSAS